MGAAPVTAGLFVKTNLGTGDRSLENDNSSVVEAQREHCTPEKRKEPQAATCSKDKFRNIMSKQSKSQNRVSSLGSGNQTIACVRVHSTLTLQSVAESEFAG